MRGESCFLEQLLKSIKVFSDNGRATSPVGRLVFKTNERLIKCLVGSTPTPSAIFFFDRGHNLKLEACCVYK
jgi:hypothetical protein